MEIRQSLEANFLTCKYCQQPYRKPKVLLCMHTFCQACLEQLLAQKEAENEAKELEAAKRYYAAPTVTSDYKSGYRKKWSSKLRYGGYDATNYNLPRYTFSNNKIKSIACPVCDKETSIPAGGIADLPTDQLADRLASMVDRMPTFPVCDVCTKQPLLEDTDEGHDQNSTQRIPTGRTVQSQYDAHKRYASSEDSSSDEGEMVNPKDKLHSSLMTGAYHQQMLNGTSNLDGHKSRRHLTESHDYVKRHRRKTVPGSVDKLCTLSGPRPASAACLECSKRLCTECRDTHAKMAVTANHVLIRLEQMEDLQCSRHVREMRRFFCLTCRTHICIVCTFENSGHADHEIMSIREAVATYQAQLSRDSALTQTHIHQVESLLGSLQVCEDEMRHLYTDIDAGVKMYLEQINREQLSLKSKVDKLAGVPLETLSSECKRLSKAANEWYEFINDDHITSRLDLMDPLEALAEAGPMLDRVGRCLRAASEPLNTVLAKQPFLMHLKAAEGVMLTNGDSGLVSSQSSLSPSVVDSLESKTNHRAIYWRACLGKFQPGHLEFGRVVTDKVLAAEAIAEASKFVTTYVQTGPELIKQLPPGKGAQRHRAIQVNLLGENLEDRAIQTDYVPLGAGKVTKVDAGTQYASADVNPPVSMYRSLKQILVQK